MPKKTHVLHDTRAITPVLSNLLLTVVAVATMTLATTATYVITTNLQETMSERIAVEDVWFNNSTGNISVYLRNVGAEFAIEVSTVYINGTKSSFTPYSYVLEIGRGQWLTISESWVSNQLYHVNIVTTRGTHIESYYKAP